jgi:hypothetical protein
VVVLDEFPLLVSNILRDYAITAKRNPLHETVESLTLGGLRSESHAAAPNRRCT